MPQIFESDCPFRAVFLARGSKLAALRLLQLRVPLHQLLQTEARKLYRNLGVFPISFALIDGPFPIFRVLDLLSGMESPPAFGLLGRHFRNLELLAPRSKELGNVVDGVVALKRTRRLRLDPRRGPQRARFWHVGVEGLVPGGALVFVFVGVVRLVWRGHSCPRKAGG